MLGDCMTPDAGSCSILNPLQRSEAWVCCIDDNLRRMINPYDVSNFYRGVAGEDQNVNINLPGKPLWNGPVQQGDPRIFKQNKISRGSHWDKILNNIRKPVPRWEPIIPVLL